MQIKKKSFCLEIMNDLKENGDISVKKIICNGVFLKSMSAPVMALKV